jgi:hypothetical protein
MQIKKEHDEKQTIDKKKVVENEKKIDSQDSPIKTFTCVEEVIKSSSNSSSNRNVLNHIDLLSDKYSNQNSIGFTKDSFFFDREQIKNSFEFLAGESLIDYDEAYYRNEDLSLLGVMAMTDYRIIFKFKDDSLMEKLNLPDDYFKLPFYLISKIEKNNEKKNMTKYRLDILTKDSRTYKFVVSSDQLKFYANLNNFVFPKDSIMHYSFAYRYREGLKNEFEQNNLVDGWEIYNPDKEYARQGINFLDENYSLKMTNLNENFKLCPTYPEKLIVPRLISDEEIKEASLYRTKNRFPILSYVYHNTPSIKGRPTYASIWRSSQTKSGLTGNKRSTEDEKLLKAICDLNDKLVIYDARPYINALANRVRCL